LNLENFKTSKLKDLDTPKILFLQNFCFAELTNCCYNTKFSDQSFSDNARDTFVKRLFKGLAQNTQCINARSVGFLNLNYLLANGSAS